MFRSSVFSTFLAAVIGFLALTSKGHAQTLQFTKTVDPSGNANHTTIQEAINAIGATDDRWTVLIYAGVYAENVTLDANDKNIDLVGVDRDAVIIRPTSNGNGITITSGSETSRHNSIRNLTIDTTASTNGGHGIEIIKGGTPVPKDISIEGVTIRAGGADKKGLEGGAADTVRIVDCDFHAAAGVGVECGDRFSIINSTIGTDKASRTEPALNILRKTGVIISNCRLDGAGRGLGVTGVNPMCSDLRFTGCDIRGDLEGMYLSPPGTGVRFSDCYIHAENDTASGIELIGVYSDWNAPGVDATFQSCRIEATGGPNYAYAVAALQFDNAEGVTFLDCDVSATSLRDGPLTFVNGIRCPQGIATLIGGTIRASHDAYNKADAVFDIVVDPDTDSPNHIFVSGVDFASWRGLVNPAGRAITVTQTVTNVADADDDAVLASTTLNISEQIITTGLTSPDVYRCVSVTGNVAGMNQDVYVIGENWGGQRIVERITLNGVSAVNGRRPFAAVSQVILPARTTLGQAVRVGTINTIGLLAPIAFGGDVLQQARAASASSNYSYESVGTVDVVFATVNVDATLEPGNSFQWQVIGPR